MKNFKYALSFLSRLPVGKLRDVNDINWAKSMQFFPICGVIISFFTFTPIILLQTYTSLSPLTSAALATALLIYWTGGLHIDGFADCCDGFGCPTDREKRKLIMKDPTIGSFAAAGLIGLLILKTTAITQIFEKRDFLQLLFVPGMARFIPVFLSRIGNYPNPSGIGKFTIGRVKTKELFVALVTLLPAFIWAEHFVAFVLMLLTSLILKRKSDQLIGGITGDVLGASIEVSEAVGFLTLCLYY